MDLSAIICFGNTIDKRPTGRHTNWLTAKILIFILRGPQNVKTVIQFQKFHIIWFFIFRNFFFFCEVTSLNIATSTPAKEELRLILLVLKQGDSPKISIISRTFYYDNPYYLVHDHFCHYCHCYHRKTIVTIIINYYIMLRRCCSNLCYYWKM